VYFGAEIKARKKISVIVNQRYNVKSKGSIKLIWIMLLMLILTGACLSGGNVSDTISKTETAAHTSTATPLPSPTPSPTYTITPLPTLTYEDKLATTKDLLTTNAGCKLPCWWGFTPGETRWEDAKRFLETIVLTLTPGEREGYSVYGVTFPVFDEFIRVSKMFPDPSILHNAYFIKDGVIEIMEIEVGLMSTYNLPNLLNEYGQPDEIYILTSTEVFHEWLLFAIYVSYSHQGIGAIYFLGGINIGDEIQGCYVDENEKMVILWPPNKEWTILQVLEKVKFYDIDFPFRLLEEVTNMDEETLYQKYKGTTEPICITIPRERFYYYDQKPTPTP